MAKKTRARAAAAGTKADPRRQVVSGSDARESERPDWFASALDEGALSSREQLTKRIFTTVEVVLCLVLVASFGTLTMAAGGSTSQGLEALFADNPAAAVQLIAACMQAFVAYLVRISYKHYAEGDAAYTTANLIALLCCEMLLQSAVGIAAMAVLLWRVWRRGSASMSAWAGGRGVGGVLFDLSGPLTALVLAAICFFASARLG